MIATICRSHILNLGTWALTLKTWVSGTCGVLRTILSGFRKRITQELQMLRFYESGGGLEYLDQWFLPGHGRR